MSQTATPSLAPNRIDAALGRLHAAGKKAFVAYIGGGDPTLAATPDLIVALAQAGADVVELGVPFSDPLADGVVNQLSAQRALDAGATLPGLLAAVAAARKRTEVPIVLFTYLNPLLRRGLAETLREAQKAGVDGALVLDLPVGETLEGGESVFPEGFRHIQLIAPTTPPERVAEIAPAASGFIYYVSRAGVTGMQSEIATGIKEQVAAIRDAYRDRFEDRAPVPICVGFGVSTPEQARTVAQTADGVVIGSAIVKKIGEWGKEPDLAKRLEEFVRPFAEAIHAK
ncbi:tryptophan synthase, alpha chain [Verrucomicrobium sp. GAS474]|uniref:tryptophan synthase subunit alpha n=1 Tax=Verrucomicrobium sp. GAS474 TaxID=1882831 RepID=UPI0008796F96|nr:tryptophan synthase subunit alpha [Verrucomicrobium sp. GAS474]SDU00143.1 tryptophan synthase, alpha chain [Verrucomicrobium sp. GAS474]